MKRSEFLKKLGIGLGVAVVAPSVVFPKEDNSTRDDKYHIGVDPATDKVKTFYICKSNQEGISLMFHENRGYYHKDEETDNFIKQIKEHFCGYKLEVIYGIPPNYYA
jgi:uncharacterized Zn-finger protein